MMELIGSHGTCRSRGDSILKYGFRLDSGRYGLGAYFWREGPEYIKLAQEWFCQEHDKGQYDSETDPTQTVIISLFTVEDDNYLDLEDHEVKCAIYTFFERKKVETLSRRKLSRLWDYFLSSFEKDLCNPIKLCNVRVAMPINSTYPVKVLGSPECLVVRDTGIIANSRFM